MASHETCYLADDIILDLIRHNITTRLADYKLCPKSEERDMTPERFDEMMHYITRPGNATEKIDRIISEELFEYAFSKGHYRLDALRLMFKGTIRVGLEEYQPVERLKPIENCVLHVQFKEWADFTSRTRNIIIATIMVVLQPFSDANHRTSEYFLDQYAPGVLDEIPDLPSKIITFHRSMPLYNEWLDHDDWSPRVLSIVSAMPKELGFTID